MSSEIIEVKLPDDQVIYVEVESPGGDVAFSRRRVVPWKDLRTDISRISHWIVDSVCAGLSSPPTHLEVEFGLKVAVESGTLIGALAKVGTEASVTVRLGWDHPDVPGGSDQIVAGGAAETQAGGTANNGR